MHIMSENNLRRKSYDDPNMNAGGNCKTVMIATMSMEQAQIQESISTARFAERVAQIPNTPAVNEVRFNT